jgi:hypothetical protein
MPVLNSDTDNSAVSTSPAKLIKRALRILGVIDPGEDLEASELKDGLEGLNHMLDSWNTERLVVPSLAKNTFSTVATHNTYSVGPGADCDIVRPSKLELGQVFISDGSVDYPALEAYDENLWQQIPDKASTGLPSVFYYDRSNPVANISLYLTPDKVYTVSLYTWKVLAQIALEDVNGALLLEPGYARAICFNLALDLADEWDGKVTPNTISTANVAKANIKALNIEPIIAMCDPGVLDRNYIYDINRGY